MLKKLINIFHSSNEKEENLDQQEHIRNFLKKVNEHYEIEKDQLYPQYIEKFSLVLLVNEDFPVERQMLSISECISDFIGHFSFSKQCIEWQERRKMSGKSHSIVIFFISAQTMSSLYAEYLKNKQKFLFPVKNVSTIQLAGVVYPVAICLGFLWEKEYNTIDFYNKKVYL